MGKKIKHIETECSDWELQRSLEWKLEDAEKAGLKKLAKACRKTLKRMRKAGFICTCNECEPKEVAPTTGWIYWAPTGIEDSMKPLGYVSEEEGLHFGVNEGLAFDPTFDDILLTRGEVIQPEIKFSFKTPDANPLEFKWCCGTDKKEF